MRKFILFCVVLFIAPVQVSALTPWTAMDKHDFKVRSMYEYYVVQGQMNKDKWQEKLSKYCKGQNVIVSVCSYCDLILGVKKGGQSISHGACYACLDKVYKEMNLMPDPQMPRARKELNEKIHRFEMFKRSG